MPVSFGSNVSSLLAQRQLSRVSSAESSSIERLASGLRINRASDDAAGLAVASTLSAQNRIFTQAIRNANDGISALTIAEGAVSNGVSILQRLRELATSASSGSYSRIQRLSSDQEASALASEFNRVFGSVDFNGLKLLNGSISELQLQLGEGAAAALGFRLGNDLKRTVGNGSYSNSQIAGAQITSSLVEADINGDGIVDLITNTQGLVALRISNGNGTFTNSVVGAATNTSQIALGDFDGDGRQDFAFVSGTTSISVLRNQGNGTFSTSSVTGFSNLSQINTADLNGDGRSDLLLTTSAGNISSYLAGPTGAFTSTASTTFAASLAAQSTGDFNGDGRIDLMVGLTTYLGGGDGSFGAGFSSGISLFTPSALADVNFDGILDAVGNNGSTGVAVTYGRGDGTFGNAQNFSMGGVVYGLRVGDLNGDGIPDIMANVGGSMRSILGVGDGTFGTVSGSLGTGAPFGGLIALADFNGDGSIDFVNAGGSSTNLHVGLQGTTQTTTLQRLNLTTASSALASLSIIDAALARASSELGGIASTQSRLSSALRTLSATRENYFAALSRITDVDVATESAALTQKQTLKQTATAVLAQANLAPALALSLLRS